MIRAGAVQYVLNNIVYVSINAILHGIFKGRQFQKRRMGKLALRAQNKRRALQERCSADELSSRVVCTA